MKEQWTYKPISINGIFDHTKELKVLKSRDGYTGAEIITPLYTHVDSQGEMRGYLVNRGWVHEKDFQLFQDEKRSSERVTVQGVLYEGDGTGKGNDLERKVFVYTNPQEIGGMIGLNQDGL